MIQQFVDRFIAKREQIKESLIKPPDAYVDLVKIVISSISDGQYNDPDPLRIHEINDGAYQGTLLYVIGASGYQPSTYWAVKIDYGSCSGCDTLQAIQTYDDSAPTKEELDQYWTLMLHIVQGLKEIE